MPTIEISKDAFDYLQSRAKPLIDSTVTVLDRIIQENREAKSGNSVKLDAEITRQFSKGNLPRVKFTSIITARIQDKFIKKPNWNNILEELIESCASQGINSSTIQTALSANTQDGNFNDAGFRYVPVADFSFQGLDAQRACGNISLLASQFSISVEILIKWQNNPRAAHPNQTARLVFP